MVSGMSFHSLDAETKKAETECKILVRCFYIINLDYPLGYGPSVSLILAKRNSKSIFYNKVAPTIKGYGNFIER